MRRFVAVLFVVKVAGENDCIKANTSYYDDSKQPVAVKYMKNAIACQAACEDNAPCEAWTFLRDAGSCWQLPASDQMVLVGNSHGVSGRKMCRPHGFGAHLQTWHPATFLSNVSVTAVTAVTAPAPTAPPVELPVHILGATAPMAEGGPPRPACASRGKALNDPLVQTLNGGFVSAAPECQSRCASAPLCVFWTFYNDTGGCWLQGANVTSFPNISAISGPKLCDVPEKASRYAAGHNISHSDQTVMMRSIPRPSCSNRGKAYRDSKVTSPNGAYLENAQLCQDACARSFYCQRFTYYIDSKACWLQGSNVTEFETPMAIAGPRACDEPQVVSLKQMQLDAVLNCAKARMANLGDELVAPEFMVKSDAVECQMGCKATTNCTAFTFYSLSHKCTLHGKNATQMASMDAISGPKECGDVAIPVGAWEVNHLLGLGQNAWRHTGATLLALVAVSGVALMVFTRKAQVFNWGSSYRNLGPPVQLDEDLEERFVEAA